MTDLIDKKHYLTPEEILFIDNIGFDQLATERYFKIASVYYQNSISRIETDRKKFWDSMRGKMGITDDEYFEENGEVKLHIKRSNGLVCAQVQSIDKQDK